MSERALAKVTGEAVRLLPIFKVMQKAAEELPLSIRIQINNVVEEYDLLRHRLQHEALRRAIYGPARDKP
jgi:hypothetical protein